jgi:hypothetical protein
MIALPVLPWVKIGIVAAVAVAIAGVSYGYGRGSCNRAAVRAMEKEIEKIEKEAARAVKQASKDARVIAAIEEAKDDIRKEADAVTSDDNCPLDDEQLRILSEIQRSTKRR